MKKKLFLFTSILIGLLSCHSGKTASHQQAEMNRTILFVPGPRAIVYKTTKDYSQNVPVKMDENRTRILSYPAPSDIYYKGVLSTPTPLCNGYWLDNRGIGANVVFLSYTYQEYSRLETSPSMEELIGHIIDKYPLLALWDCGTRNQYKEETKELNQLIKNGFEGCKMIVNSANNTPNKVDTP